MSKHTPGEWRVEPECSYGYDIRSEGEKWVCSANNDHGNPERFPTNEESLSNAHLIAAAPDLLEALEFVVEKVRTADLMVVGADIVINDAIAKARGEK